MILERTTDEMHAVGEQRGGDGIAFQRIEGLSVEGETRGLGGGQAALAGNAIGAAHFAVPSVVSLVAAAVVTPGISGLGSPAL